MYTFYLLCPFTFCSSGCWSLEDMQSGIRHILRYSRDLPKLLQPAKYLPAISVPVGQIVAKVCALNAINHILSFKLQVFYIQLLHINKYGCFWFNLYTSLMHKKRTFCIPMMMFLLIKSRNMYCPCHVRGCPMRSPRLGLQLPLQDQPSSPRSSINPYLLISCMKMIRYMPYNNVNIHLVFIFA